MTLENPALNGRSFPRGIEEADTEPRGMTAAGTYVITGLLFVIVMAAAAFGLSQVEIVPVGGREDALTPAWTWLAFLLTFIVAIVDAFAYRAAHLRLVRFRRGFAPWRRLSLLRPEVRRHRVAGADRHVVHVLGSVPPLQPPHRHSCVKIRDGGHSVNRRVFLLYMVVWLLSCSGWVSTFCTRPPRWASRSASGSLSSGH
jgi:hypothetical protein